MPTKLKLFRKAVAMILGVWLFAPSLFAGYYHTQGNQIVDENGNPAIFHGINWFGFETANYSLHGLWSRSMNSYLDQMHALGYNLLRVPYCNQMFDPGVMPNGIDFYSNPDLQGLTPIQVLDKLVERAGARGMKIMLDRHRPDSSAQSELWYTSGISEQRWIADWKMLAQRYAGNDTVIAADLHNEPHGSATWGTGNTATDWRLAAERCGNAILSVNPNWLIVVEGVENFQNDFYWWGGNLKGAGTYPVRLDVANRLVYSPHDYGPGVFLQTWFNDPNFPANMPGVWSNHWAYLHLQGTAPVLVGEFGGKSVDLVSKEGIWQNALVDYIATNQIYWTYWCWNPNSGDTGGVLNDDWTTVNTNKQNMLNRLINAAPPQPPTPPSAPANLGATALSATQVRLSWTDTSSNEDSVRIERSNNGLNFSEIATVGVNVATYTNTGLTAVTTYYYRIRATNAAGASPYSTIVNVTTRPPPPTTPTGLNAIAVSTSGIILSWTDNATNEAGFKIERSTDGINFGEIATNAANVAGFTNSGLAAAATYHYRVRAFNADGNSAYSNLGTATTFSPALNGPTNLTAAAVSSSRIDLAWSDNVTNADGFMIERSTDGSNFVPVTTTGPHVNFFFDTGLAGSTSYFYRVRAFNSGGESLYSNIARASTPPINALTVFAAADFETNTPGQLTGQAGGFGWSGGWTVNTDTNKVLVLQPLPLLAVGTLSGGAKSLKLERSMYNETLATRALAVAPSGDDVYVSFLYRRTGGVQDDFIGFWLGNKSGPTIGADGNQFAIRPCAGIAAQAPTTIQAGSDYFVVGHFFKTVGGATNAYDGAELWVNPATGILSAPQAHIIGLTANSIASFQTFGLKAWGTSENDTNLFDRIVLGARWNDVAPTAIATAGFEDNSLTGLNGQFGGEGWATAWTVSLDLTKVNVVTPAQPLSFAAGNGSISGGAQALEIKRAMFNDNLLRRDLIATAAGNDVFVSFLYRKTAGALNETDLLWLGHKAGPALGVNGNRFQIRTAENIATNSSTVIQSGADYFVVGHFSKTVPGPTNDYDRAELWVNPVNGSLTAPEAIANGANANSLATFATVGMKVTGAADDDAFLLDRLAIGTQWTEIAPTTTSRFVQAGWSGSGQFRVSFAGDAGGIYSVWASSNLVDWVDLGPAEAVSPGLFQFTDSSPANQQKRFYRLR